MQGVYGPRKFVSQYLVHQALLGHPVKPVKRGRGDDHREMGFPSGTRAGMAGMVMRVINDLERDRVERVAQFTFYGFRHGHSAYLTPHCFNCWIDHNSPMDEYNAYGTEARWQQEPESRTCDWPDCEHEGEHKAPRNRENLRDYLWFCLDHVREYNKSWNYLDGIDSEELRAMQWSSATWNRPTWPLNDRVKHNAGRDATTQAEHIRDAADQFRDSQDPGTLSAEDLAEFASRARLTPEDRLALDVLGLKATATLRDVKKRYKQLVKRFHPDANGGAPDSAETRKESEDQLRMIIAAYSHLVKSPHLTNST